MSLPPGLLLAWLGDDFTGGAAVAETLAFAGLPTAMFLEPPDAATLARFPGLRAVGLATTARAETPEWMDAHLPGLYAALLATGVPLLHYKACSTMDSAPGIGSLGRALELGLAATGEACAPILFASPEMGRYQAFGHLFAAEPGGIHRIDRHPVMARHPVTPIDEADIARHLAQQTDFPLAALPPLLDVPDTLHLGSRMPRPAFTRLRHRAGISDPSTVESPPSESVPRQALPPCS